MTAIGSLPSAHAGPIRWLRLAVMVLGVGILAAVDLYLAGRSIGIVASGADAVDWGQYVEASRRVHGEGLYAVSDTYGFHYSPLFAYAVGAVSWLGTAGWRVLHVVAALAMPTWPMRLITLASWPFWYDVEAGNVLVFVVLAAAWSMRGNRVGIASTLVLAVLVPRPLIVPVVAWLLWRFPKWRIPFVVVFAAHGGLVLLSGWADEWFRGLIAAGGDVGIPSNIGPSRFTGTVPWMAIGIPLGAWLTWKGRLGLAGLAVSPYWLPYYLLMLVLGMPTVVRGRFTSTQTRWVPPQS